MVAVLVPLLATQSGVVGPSASPQALTTSGSVSLAWPGWLDTWSISVTRDAGGPACAGEPATSMRVAAAKTPNPHLLDMTLPPPDVDVDNVPMRRTGPSDKAFTPMRELTPTDAAGSGPLMWPVRPTPRFVH